MDNPQPAMEEAIEDFVSGIASARDQVGMGPEQRYYDEYFANVDFRGLAEDLRTLWNEVEREDCGQGWPSSKEADLRRVLSRAFPPGHGESSSGHRSVARVLMSRRTGAWRDVFLMHNRVSVASVDGSEAEIELYRSWGVRFNSYVRTSQFLYALRTLAVAESHEQYGQGWHFHLVRGGHRLGYRLFFDSNRTQQDLAWEKHGTGHVSAAGGSLPYGDPGLTVLDAVASRSIHHACLAAARDTSPLRQCQPFAVWASKFVRSSSDSFVAHPPVQGQVPVEWGTSR